jgi:hypothetical protein
MLKDELLEVGGPSETDLENVLTHFPSSQVSYLPFKPCGTKHTTPRIIIKPYYNNPSGLMPLMFGLISCSNFKRSHNHKLTHNATMVMLIKLNKRSDEYLFKNEADNGEFRSIEQMMTLIT